MFNIRSKQREHLNFPLMDILRQIQDLRIEIDRHNIRYYVHDDPIISDAE